MVKFESILALMFDGSNYFIWYCIMEVYLSTLGYDVWMLVVNAYSIPICPPTDLEEKRRYV